MLFRHAKAERTSPGGDHGRALTKSGRKDSAAMGEIIAEQGPVDLVLSSDAVRARETWEHASPALSPAPEVRFLRAIYEAESYLPILQEEGGDAQAVLLVGHNPTMHAAALSLADSLAGPQGAVLAGRFPKAALAVLDFDGPWADLRPGKARIVAFFQP
jgi:phosphohistidine phosphatase